MQWFIFFTYAAWLISEILLNRLVRSAATDQPRQDRRSLSLIWITIAGSVTAAVIVGDSSYWPVVNSMSVVWIGVALIWLGMLLRGLIIRSLGTFFTVDVTIRKDHQLKTDGIYHYLRHPSYSASLLSFIGFGLSLNHVASLLIVVVCILVAFLYRIRVEEKGADYAFWPAIPGLQQTYQGPDPIYLLVLFFVGTTFPLLKKKIPHRCL